MKTLITIKNSTTSMVTGLRSLTLSADSVEAMMSEIRSYTIFKDSTTQKLQLKPSHWAPGYTPAHKATPEEAIEYEFQKTQKERDLLALYLSDLYELSQKLVRLSESRTEPPRGVSEDK